MREALTSRQQEVLNVIEGYIHERGYPPTMREIGRELNIRSTNGVNDHLKALERKGYLTREENRSRALRPTDMSTNILEVPLVGRVAAGEPLLAEENIEDTVKIDRFFIGSTDNVFALKVQGDSMYNDGIRDGDYLFVRKQLTATPGEIVVAMIENEATVKRYFPEGEKIRFQPANDAFEPIYVHKSDFRSVDLVGIVVGVYRQV